MFFFFNYVGIIKCFQYGTLVRIYVAGLLLVVGGGVQEVMRQIVWSEALFALTCCGSNQ
jgi:hypothetical protein